jgi:hypothetical protein
MPRSYDVASAPSDLIPLATAFERFCRNRLPELATAIARMKAGGSQAEAVALSDRAHAAFSELQKSGLNVWAVHIDTSKERPIAPEAWSRAFFPERPFLNPESEIRGDEGPDFGAYRGWIAMVSQAQLHAVLSNSPNEDPMLPLPPPKRVGRPSCKRYVLELAHARWPPDGVPPKDRFQCAELIYAQLKERLQKDGVEQSWNVATIEKHLPRRGARWKPTK